MLPIPKFCFLLAFCIPCCFPLKASEFDHPATHFSGNQIKEFALMGQRCSGTKFIQQLVKQNFPSYVFNETASNPRVPHKHHWPFINENSHYPFFNYDACLFILVVRNPYTWLQSFFSNKALQPHHTRETFQTFITSKWKYKSKNYIPKENANEFDNILKVRNLEMKNFLEIGTRVANFVVINYDTAAKDPKGLIAYLSKCFDLNKKSVFVPCVKWLGYHRRRFVPHEYGSINAQDLEFINAQLNWEVEKSFGYFPLN